MVDTFSQPRLLTCRRYHVPRAWLRPEDNLLVLLEELTGDPYGIRLATRSLSSVCGLVSSNHPPPLETWGIKMVGSEGAPPPAELRLQCDPGQRITGIRFASLGNPQGSCTGEGFKQGSCHLASSADVVEKVRNQLCITQCLGKIFPDAELLLSSCSYRRLALDTTIAP